MAQRHTGHNNNPGGGGGGGGGTQAGSGHPAAAVSAAQPAGGLPSWLTSSGGGTGAPVPISGWLSPDYPGGYAGWLKDHPNAGHDPTPPSNNVYKAWLQQHVGSDGQLHLPPAGGSADTNSATPPASNSGQPGTTLTIDHNKPASADTNGPKHGTTIKQPGGQNVAIGSATPAPGGGPVLPANSDIQPIPIATPTAGAPSPSATSSDGAPTLFSSIDNSTGSPTASGSQSQQSNQGSYAVVRGDTLSGIAAAHGMTTSQLEALNPQISNPDLILPGQTINTGNASNAGAVPTGSAVATDSNSGFPTSSTYPPTDGNKVTALDQKNFSQKHGWATGPGNAAADPVKAVMGMAAAPSTDPLKIKENGKNKSA